MKVKRKLKGLSLSFMFIFSLILMNANVGAVSISTNETVTISSSVVDGTDDEYLVTVNFDGELDTLGAGTQKADVILVMDNSGSMSGTPLATAKANSKVFVSEILANPDNRVSVICFGSTAVNYIGLNDSITNTHAAIDTIGTNGGTQMRLGIEEAKNELDTNGRSDASKVIVVLADGATSNISGTQAAVDTLMAAYPGVTIKTIGYGLVSGSAAETIMKDIAAKDTVNGHYYNSSNDDLSTVFADIASSIQADIPKVNVNIAIPENYTLVPTSVSATTAATISETGGVINVDYLNVAPNSPHTIQFKIKIDQAKAATSTTHTTNSIPVKFTYDYTDNSVAKQSVKDLSVNAPIYKITTTTNKNGTISDGRYVGRGATHTVSFNAKEGYVLKSLKDNNVEQKVNATTYSLSGIANDHKIEVNFAKPTAAPATGDSTNIGLWIAIAGISSMVFVSFLKRKSYK